MMMVGVLVGRLLAAWSAKRFFEHGRKHAATAPAQNRETPSVAISTFGRRETHVAALILVLISLAFLAQSLVIGSVPSIKPDQ